jgi:hypothetical protein
LKWSKTKEPLLNKNGSFANNNLSYSKLQVVSCLIPSVVVPDHAVTVSFPQLSSASPVLCGFLRFWDFASEKLDFTVF